MKKALIVTRRIWSHDKGITHRAGRKTVSVYSLSMARAYAEANGYSGIKVVYK